MPDLLRQEVASAQTIVVKVGTRVLTHDDGTLNRQRIEQLAEEISLIRESGRHVVLVSSGAVGAGMSRLELSQRPTDVAQLQAVAAVGQSNLIEVYDQTFRKNGHHAAQVLLTADDFDDRSRYLNVRNTLLALQNFGATPVINENDTIAVDELTRTFGDNDRLAALVTNLILAPLLVILSDVPGLYDGDPALPESKVIPTVSRLDDSIYALVRDRKTGLSKGGMASKLEAARIATSAGENVIIASGRESGVLAKIVAGEEVGTLFLAKGKTITSRKRWLAFTVRPSGVITIDKGACAAIANGGRSLLAIGVKAVAGKFGKGDVVSLCNEHGKEIARGLSNFAAEDIGRIKGLHSEFIPQVLGHASYAEVVHRDNLVTV